MPPGAAFAKRRCNDMRIIRLELRKYFHPVRLLLVLALLCCFCFAVSESQRKALSLTDTAS